MGILSKPDLKTLFTCNKVATLIDSLMHVSENGLLITAHSVAANGNVTLRFSDGSFLTIEKEDLAALKADVVTLKSQITNKVDAVDGKGLSANDLSDELLSDLQAILTNVYTKEEVDELLAEIGAGNDNFTDEDRIAIEALDVSAMWDSIRYPPGSVIQIKQEN